MNPITAVRERRGWSRRQLAAAMNLSYNAIAAVECGYPRQLPAGIRRGLAVLGEDVDRIAAEYAEWRRQQATERGGAA